MAVAAPGVSILFRFLEHRRPYIGGLTYAKNQLGVRS